MKEYGSCVLWNGRYMIIDSIKYVAGWYQLAD